MKLVAVTSCPSGVAHTYMSAEALKYAAKLYGVPIKVETQGLTGAENPLTLTEIQEADYVILTNDTVISGMERFKGKKAVRLPAQDIIDNAEIIVGRLVERN